MEVIVHDHKCIYLQSFHFFAKFEGLHDNVTIFLRREYRHPFYNRGGHEIDTVSLRHCISASFCSFLDSQTVPNELCADSLYSQERYKINILPVIFSVTVQNIPSACFFIPFQYLSLGITCYSTL